MHCFLLIFLGRIKSFILLFFFLRYFYYYRLSSSSSSVRSYFIPNTVDFQWILHFECLKSASLMKVISSHHIHMHCNVPLPLTTRTIPFCFIPLEHNNNNKNIKRDPRKCDTMVEICHFELTTKMIQLLCDVSSCRILSYFNLFSIQMLHSTS